MKRQHTQTEKLEEYKNNMATHWPNPYSAPTQPLVELEDPPAPEQSGVRDALFVVAVFSFLLGFFVSATLALAVITGFLIHHGNFFS